MTETTKTEYVIDAAGKRLGRVATEAASVLLGKNTTDVMKNTVTPVSVQIINASKLDISEKKRQQEEFRRYSGYPGGLKKESLGHFINRRGYAETVRKTVSGMIPKNKLHTPRMKNLTVTE